MTYDIHSLDEIIQEAKRLATAYYSLTKRPLGVTGEIAEYEAVRILGLQRSEVRQAGYDATYEKDGQKIRVQIKGRCTHGKSKRGQRIGSIRLDHEWDEIILALLDEDLEPTGIFIADRPAIEQAIKAPGSKARNERGSLAISKFTAISREVWSM